MLVQHEYGIFGGESGEYLVDLSALTVPYVVTLHTLLQEPSPSSARAPQSGGGAAQVTVFTAMAATRSCAAGSRRGGGSRW